MLRIKEVEMVESVDGLKSSRSIEGKDFHVFLKRWTRNLCLLWTRSSRISYFKKKVSLEEQKAQKEERFLRGRQIAYLIYEYFRVTGANDSVENYAEPIYSCSSK